ncbi:DUF1830 domain-containing protein [Oscillatoria sp. FACHB-1406]|uniref:DUF1830 domain-containing protein n=1 Tax=Oscillatoria sp. FACHB-1406 TaxID=2692846 RepID=UPI0016863BE9|nr:DUF1830 domain-containing protein [Oscillatoria sp. FACHB-1406]MBD2578761.1 DUF1830 domain-containing protein [Oscillatoria sp. FACHB-1406]
MIQTYLSREDAVTSSRDSLLCFYSNQSHSVQVLRIANISHNYWERVVFPGQRLLFEATRDAKLEVYSSENFNNLLADVIPCYKLEVKEE